jgi:hypothetical protein
MMSSQMTPKQSQLQGTYVERDRDVHHRQQRAAFTLTILNIPPDRNFHCSPI